jgi:hypothetical protein
VQNLADLLAKTFIARSDVKAVQNTSGEYMPVQHCTDCGRGFCNHETPKVREGWKRADIEAHLTGNKTYGHYLLNMEDQCKLFAFDIDLDKPELFDNLDPMPVPRYIDQAGSAVEFNPRTAWLDRAHPARGQMKLQLKTVAHALMKAIVTELEIPVACTYTGAKGLHVYGFTGLMSAKDVREGAQIVLDSLRDSHLGAVSAVKGDCFFRFDNQDPEEGQPNLTIEVFPKQDSLGGKDLGNLMRIPLGKNLKNPKDPTFFLDMTSALSDIKMVDPIYALTDGATRPWRRQGE